MDDRIPENAWSWLNRGDGAREGKRAEHVPWSCIDYVDAIHEDYKKATQERKAKTPDSDGLRERFGKLDGHDARRGDGKGRCQESVRVPQRGDSYLNVPVSCSFDNRHRGLQGDAHDTHRWYKGKQTNRGWPGTAEGKINTAQGMAGDLVENLNNA